MRIETPDQEVSGRAGISVCRPGMFLLGVVAMCLAGVPSPAIAGSASSADDGLVGEDSERAKPGFAGVWFSLQSFHHENDDPAALFRRADDPQPLPGGKPHLKEPYATQYIEQLQGARAVEDNFDLPIDSENQCLPDGMPKMMRGILPIEILQEPGKIVILTEEMGQVRRIFLDGGMPPIEEIAPSYAGYSTGHWEGDTLVVDTVSLLSEVNFLGIPNSGNVTLTERMRLVSPNVLEIKFTYEDPVVLDQPYRFTWTYERHNEHRILEYICDSNRYLTEPDGTMFLSIDPE